MRFLPACTVLIIILLASCQSDPPELQNIQWYLEIASSSREKEADTYLHLLVELREEQGFSDIMSITIKGPDDLLWDISPESLPYQQEGSLLTLEIGRLAPIPGSEGFPAGTYRFSVTDIPGNRDEKEFFLPSSSAFLSREENIPKIERDDDVLTVSGSYTLLLYAADGRLISRETAEGETVLFSGDTVPAYYYILAQDDEYPVIYSLGPVYP